MERITVEVNVICPTHQQIMGYMEARQWHMVARRKRNEGRIYSRWQMIGKHYIVDIHESPEFPDYWLRQRNAVKLLADYDHWLDEYSLVKQLLRGGVIGQDYIIIQADAAKVYFSDMGVVDYSSLASAGGFWKALDSKTRVI